MTDHPVNDAVVDGENVSKAEFRSYEIDYNRLRVPSVAWVQARDLSDCFGFDLGGLAYDRDTSDTTTAHDGVATIVDLAGTRFKRVFDDQKGALAFAAYKSVDQTGIAAQTFTKVTFQTEQLDLGGYYDSSNAIFLPPAGNYVLKAGVAFSAGLVDQSRFGFAFYKNGVPYRFFQNAASAASSLPVNIYGSIVVAANGSDYFEIYAYAEGSGSKTVWGSNTMTFFSGFSIDGVAGPTGEAGPTGATGLTGPQGEGLAVDVYVADITERNTHGGDPVGTVVAVSDIGDGTSAIYQLEAPSTWSDPIHLNEGQRTTVTASIAANTNDWAPTGWGNTVGWLRITSSGTFNVTGLVAQLDGNICIVSNVGATGAIVLVNASTSSAAANRFALEGDVTLQPAMSIALIYDLTSGRWRPVSELGALGNTLRINNRVAVTNDGTYTIIRQGDGISNALILGGAGDQTNYSRNEAHQRQNNAGTPLDLLSITNYQLYVPLRLDSGKIVFPATQVPSADDNTLDDWETGTFTPVLTFTTPGDVNPTYSVQHGRYWKVGNRVIAEVTVATSTFTHTTASGSLTISGLPFTPSASITNMVWTASACTAGWTKANYTQVVALIAASASVVNFPASGSGQSLSFLDQVDVPTGATVRIRFTLEFETTN